VPSGTSTGRRRPEIEVEDVEPLDGVGRGPRLEQEPFVAWPRSPAGSSCPSGRAHAPPWCTGSPMARSVVSRPHATLPRDSRGRRRRAKIALPKGAWVWNPRLRPGAGRGRIEDHSTFRSARPGQVPAPARPARLRASHGACGAASPRPRGLTPALAAPAHVRGQVELDRSLVDAGPDGGLETPVMTRRTMSSLVRGLGSGAAAAAGAAHQGRSAAIPRIDRATHPPLARAGPVRRS